MKLNKDPSITNKKYSKRKKEHRKKVKRKGSDNDASKDDESNNEVTSEPEPESKPTETEPEPKPTEPESEKKDIRSSYYERDIVLYGTNGYDVGIIFGFILIPIAAISIIWDLLAIIEFKIPHMTFNNYPLFLLALQFFAFFLSVYGHIHRVVRKKKGWLTTLSCISIIIHLILIIVRAYIEINFDTYRPQKRLYFITYKNGVDNQTYSHTLISYEEFKKDLNNTSNPDDI